MKPRQLLSLSIPLTHTLLAACEPIKLQSRRLELDTVGEDTHDVPQLVLQPLRFETNDVAEWENLMESELRKNVEILDEWAQESLGTAAGWFQDILDNIQARFKLLDNALISARSHCYVSKLDAIARHVVELSESVSGSNPDIVLKIQEFRKIIETHQQIPSDALSTREGVWENYTNNTSVTLQTNWAALRPVLKSAVEPHSPNVIALTKYVSTGFASSWGEIKAFAGEHKFTAADIERLIKDHPVMFAVFAGLLVTGGVWLLAGPEMIVGLLELIGFSPLGPVEGSLAAQWQAISYGAAIPKGSIFSVLQRVAMTRIIAPSGAAVLLGGALVATGGVIIYVLVDGRLEFGQKSLDGTRSLQELD